MYMWGWLNTSSDSKAAQDQRLAKAVLALMQHVTVELVGNIISHRGDSSPNAPLWEVLREFGAIHKADPKNPVLHYAYAAAMASAMQYKTAEDILLEIDHEHPEFWLADVTLRNWEPWNTVFLLPAFGPTDAAVDRRIDLWVKTAVVLSTCRGVLPRSVIFVRRESVFGSVELSTLKSSRIEFITVISKVNDPQVVAIYFRLHDDPVRPLQYEMLAVPFHGRRERFAYEVFVRQQTFDFVVLDAGGRIVHVREVTPSRRMEAAHRTLVEMFNRVETTEEVDSQRQQVALLRHQSTIDFN
jgi:hypothetical protein